VKASSQTRQFHIDYEKCQTHGVQKPAGFLVESSNQPIFPIPRNSPKKQRSQSHTAQPMLKQAAEQPTDHWLLARAQANPTNPALIDENDRSYTWKELADISTSIAENLASAGLPHNGRVAFLAENTALSVAAIHGISLASGILIPVNARLSPNEICTLLEKAKPSLILATESTARAIHKIPTKPEITVLEDIRFAHTHARRDLSPAPPLRPLLPSMDQLIVPSSGTTGTPKGVRLTFAANAASARAVASHFTLTTNDRWVACLPLAHVGGLAILWRSLLTGAAVILASPQDTKAIDRAAAQHKGTLASLVPTQLERLTGLSERKSEFRAVLIGGASVDPALLIAAHKAKIPAYASYGMTEMASTIAIQPLSEKTGTLPLPTARVVIVDEENQPLPPGKEGRVCVGGPMLSPGYAWSGQPFDRTPENLFRTNDRAVITPQGILHIRGRADHMLIIRGENVHPVEIEQVIRSHPFIRDVMVKGEKDSLGDSLPVAHVVLHPGTSSLPADIQTYCRARLAGVKVPCRWEIVETLPRNPAGKLVRHTRHT